LKEVAWASRRGLRERSGIAPDPTAYDAFRVRLSAGRNSATYRKTDVRRRLNGIDINPANSIIFLTENKPVDWSFSEARSVKSVLGL
jgi:hypothetical protein